MRNLLVIIFSFGIGLYSFSQITTNPPLPLATDEVVITFDATQGNGDLAGYTGDIYAHTGVTIEGEGRWQYVIESWGNNTTQPKLTRVGTDLYELEISPSINEFYGVASGEKVTEICIVFRSANDPYSQTADLFIDVYESGLAISITSPTTQPYFVDRSSTFDIHVDGKESSSTVVKIDGTTVHTETDLPNNFDYTINTEPSGTHEIIVEATNGSSSVSDSFFYVARSEAIVETLPSGLKDGINYTDDDAVTLVLHAPFKNSVYVFSSVNDWQPIAMKKNLEDVNDPELRYWITISGLTSQEEYIYQYIIDEELKIADPYTEKVLDPWNDKYISTTTYPNLIQYPENTITGIASVFQIDSDDYDWEVSDFTSPAKKDLIIYELHIRDFVEDEYVMSILDKLDYLETLGVNAIELMPINEFEGNDSWGYNPSFYFATDKAYGTKSNYKEFIDECHKRDIAVIIDMVLNHSFGQSPFVQMYFDESAGEWGEPTSSNPWYNESCPHPPYCWGYDFDHTSQFTQDLIDRVAEFWLTEFKVDGFRFDFTKGFTNVLTGGEGWNYNAQRIGLLKRYADFIWSVNPNAYVILEHFTDNTEEKELAQYRSDEGMGMLIWGNITHAYNEASMGWLANSNFSSVSYKNRGWSVPHLVGYMESHDEERMMYKNLEYGNSSNPAYDVKSIDIALLRQQLVGAFFFTIPGPKMIWQFGEIGYDISIDYNGRTGRKPVKWNYFGEWERRRLYNIWAELIALREAYPTFTTDNFSVSLSGASKQITLLDNDLDIVVVGNFDVFEKEITATFPSTGQWFEYYSQSDLSVETLSQVFTFAPGEFRLYSSSYIDRDDFILSSPTVESTSKDIDINVWPNPLSSNLKISILSDRAQPAEVNLYDINGRHLESVYKGTLLSGYNEIEWTKSHSIKTGIYMLVITTQSAREVKKVVVQ